MGERERSRELGSSTSCAASAAGRSIRSRAAAAPPVRTRAARPAATSAGSRSLRRRRAAPLRRGSAAGAAPRDRADAAEVVVARRPAPDRAARAARASSSAASSTPGSALHDLAGRVDARPVDRVLRLQALVEDPGGARRRAPSAGACRPRRRSRATRPSPSSASVGAIMLPSARPASSGADEEVGLAEHAVQMQVEAGQEVARAEAEAGREHAGACRPRRRRRGSSCARRAGVRRARRASASTRSRRDRPAQARQPPSVSGTPESPPRVSNCAPGVRRPRPARVQTGLVRREVVARDEPAALRDQREQRLRERPVVDVARALVGEQLERRRRAPAGAACRPPRAAGRPARRSARPRRIVITGSSIARQAACAGGNSTPLAGEPQRRLARAAARAAARARARARRARPARPGTPHEAGPTA